MHGIFFQAEDGIRYDLVTGVQTCALPIFPIPTVAGIGPIISKGLRVEAPQSFPKVDVPKLGIPPSHLPHAAITAVNRTKDFDLPTQAASPAKVPSWAKAVGLRRIADLPAPQPLMHKLPEVARD